MNSILPQLLLQVILIFLNAFFAAAEIAVISLNASKLRKSAEDGDKTCARLLKLVEEPSGFLSTIQIGITLAGFLGSAFAADNFSGYLVDWVYKDLGFHSLPVSVLDTLSVIVITIILSYFTLIFGELVPKRIAMQKSFAVAKFVYRVVSFVALIMKPAVAFLSLSTNLVRNCMTHESEIIAISADATDEEITQLITESGTSRYPVYQNDLHDIIGVLNARTFLLSRANGEKTNIRKLLRPAYFIPETVHASTLFRDMQKQKLHIAIVVDEYGDTSGIVTLEDLVEEIFGNIYDEFDENEPAEIEQLKENLWRVTGTADVDDIAKELDIDLPESSDYTTLGGMVFSNLKTIPKDGTTVDLDVGDIHIHVDAISRRRIQSALVSKVEKEPEEE